MKFMVENECLARSTDGTLSFLGHNLTIDAAVARLNECALANKCPDDDDVALVERFTVLDQMLAEVVAEQIEVLVRSKHQIR